MTPVIALVILIVGCTSLLCGHSGSHASGALSRRRRT